MTIMVAGGLTIAFPGAMPEAMAANANLFVSAENSNYGNIMIGPQVVEVVIIDSDINETNEANGEPDVTVNGKKLRMAQATDGNWYGYFADKTQATRADNTTTSTGGGIGLDFGQFCGSQTVKVSKNENSALFSDTVGVALPIRTNSTAYGVNGTSFTNATCSGDYDGISSSGSSSGVRIQNSTHSNVYVQGNQKTTVTQNVASAVEDRVSNVVREAKKINSVMSGTTGIGQIELKDDGLWPFIQLYDLTTGGNVVITYAKGGGVQTTTLTFDTYGDVTETLDRAKYPQGAQVHFTVNDPWLDIDPTDEDSWTFDTSSASGYGIHYQFFNENGADAGDGSTTATKSPNLNASLSDLMAEEGVLKLNPNTQGVATANIPIKLQDNDDVVYATCTTAALCKTNAGGIGQGGQPITLLETSTSSGVFTTFDESDVSQLIISSNAIRGTSGTITYADAHTILVGNSFATIDIQPNDDTWNSGEEIDVVLVDEDQNKNSRSDEDLTVKTYTNSTLIPALQTGDPFTIGENRTSAGVAQVEIILGDKGGNVGAGYLSLANQIKTSETVSKFSEIALADPLASSAASGTDSIVIDYNLKVSDLLETVKDPRGSNAASRLMGINLLNLDVSGFNSTGTFSVYLLNSSSQIISDTGNQPLGSTVGLLRVANGVDPKSLTSLNTTAINTALFTAATTPVGNYVGLLIQHDSDTTNVVSDSDAAIPIVADFFSFGFTDDGSQSSERVSNQIVRIEVEETGDNTATFEGSLEYVMVNQLNIYKAATYEGLDPIDDSAIFLVIEDLTDEDSPRVNYLDLGSDGVSTQIADQQTAPTHSGVVSFDNENYKVADTVTITLEDADLNTDSELIDIYTVVTATNSASGYDVVGAQNDSNADLPTLSWGYLGRLLDVTFDDEQWLESNRGAVTCGTNVSGTDGLGETNFSLVETSMDSGVFVGDFQIPDQYCKRSGYTGSNGVATSTTGVDIEVNYVDFRDASGEIIEVGDGAGVRANTGSVTLDRTVYPVPFGVTGDFSDPSSSLPSNRAVFPIHQSGVASTTTLAAGEFIANGDLTIHVRVNDPDFDQI
jgi:hypothetical protein